MAWPGIHKDVSTLISRCPICQKIRIGQGSVLAALATTAKSVPGQTVVIDTIGPLPKDESGNVYLIVLIDAFSRYVELEPSPDVTAK